ncbi:MAG TPA: T9SS type A sorting domain-containing protein [bacterium]|jgi:hypothetical protein
MKLSTLFLLLTVFCTATMADPRLWGPQGLALTGNGRVEWDQSTAWNDAGYAAITWSDMRNNNREVYAQLIGPDGDLLWGNGVQITNNAQEQSSALITAIDGGWIVAWIDYRNVPRGDPDYNDYGGEIRLQKLNNQGQPLWTADGVRVDSSTYVSRASLRLLPDSTGGALLAWMGRASSGALHIYAARITGAGEAAWPTVTVLPSGVNALVATTDNSDGMILAWVENTVLKASRIAASGAQPWGTVTVRDSVSYYYKPAIASDGNNGFYVSWVNTLLVNNFDIWAQHVSATGQRLWADRGIPVCTASSTQYDVAIATSTNAGVVDGCLLTWYDQREGGQAHYYTQKLDAGGTALWGENGTLLCDSASSGQILTPVSDNEGGLVAAWDFWVGTAYEGRSINAVRLNASGVAAWPQGTVPVCDDPLDDDQLPAIIPQPDGFLAVFETGTHGDEVQQLALQKLGRASGERELTPRGITLVSFPTTVIGNGIPVPMSNGRTALVGSNNEKTCFQILSTDGRPQLNPDSIFILPDTTGVHYEMYPEYFYTGQACSDGSGGFFALQSWGNDESGYEAFLGHVSSEGQVLNNGRAGWVWEGADVTDYGMMSSLISPDSAGGCYVSFQLWYPETGVYLMRMNAECQRMWTQPVCLDTVAWYQSNETKVATTADGSCIVAWSGSAGYRLGGVSAAGTLRWTVAVSDYSDWDLPHPKLTTDGQNGAYCTWMENVNAPEMFHVHAQHVNENGEELWPHGGLRVSTQASWQAQSRPMTDNAGNLIVIWTNESEGIGYDLRAQKMSPDGARLWSDSGRVVCNAPTSQRNPAVVSDFAGGVFVAWEDANDINNGKSHISATHLDSDGFSGPDPYWVQNEGGIISDTAANANVSPVIIAGAAGSAVVLWSQDLNQSAGSAYSLFAQRISAAPLASGSDVILHPSAFSLSQNYPNPFNPTTRISFDLAKAGMTKLTLFNLLGQEVRTLTNEYLTAGAHQVNLDASCLPSGLYIYRLESGSSTASRKMILLK